MKQTKKTPRSVTVDAPLSLGWRVMDLYFQSLSRLQSAQEGAETWVSEMYLWGPGHGAAGVSSGLLQKPPAA